MLTLRHVCMYPKYHRKVDDMDTLGLQINYNENIMKNTEDDG